PRVRISHISGAEPGGPRWDPKRTDDERRALENLLALCPTRADHIDYVEPAKYTKAVLFEMKRRHEELANGSCWYRSPPQSGANEPLQCVPQSQRRLVLSSHAHRNRRRLREPRKTSGEDRPIVADG